MLRVSLVVTGQKHYLKGEATEKNDIVNVIFNLMGQITQGG